MILLEISLINRFESSLGITRYFYSCFRIDSKEVGPPPSRIQFEKEKVVEWRVFYHRTDLRGSSNATNSRYKRDGCCDAHFPDRVFHTREFSHTRKSITDNSSYFKIVVDNLSVWKITTSIRSFLFLLEATIFTLVVSFNFKMKQTSSLFFPSTRDITKGKKIKEE